MINFPGVYAIENKLNGNRYIGSTTNLRVRRNRHFDDLRRGTHDKPHLQWAFNFYGEDVFTFKVILTCEKYERLRYEQTMINALKPEYNILPIAGSPLGTKRTQESIEIGRQKMIGQKRTEEQRANMRHSHIFSYIPTEEHKEKNRLIHTGKKHTPESIEKMCCTKRNKENNQ